MRKRAHPFVMSDSTVDPPALAVGSSGGSDALRPLALPAAMVALAQLLGRQAAAEAMRPPPSPPLPVASPRSAPHPSPTTKEPPP